MSRAKRIVKGLEELVDEAGDLLPRLGRSVAVKTTPELEKAPPLRVPRRRQKPQVRLVRPDPEDADPVRWLQRARTEAAERYGTHNRLPGKVTASVKGRVELDPKKLANIPGAMGEQRVPGDEKYDRLMASVQEKGFDPNTHIWLGINHLGEPYVAEGNTRLAVARDLGIDRIPAEVMWYGGGEQVGGLMEPGLLEHYMPPSELMLDPGFSRWFEGSKGVDEFGEPKMFYHGTNVYPEYGLGDFSVFDRMTGVDKLRKPMGMDTVGSWFSDRADEQGAGMYAGYYGDPTRTPGTPGAIMPVYLKYTNPWKPSSFDEFLDRGNELDWNYDATSPRGRFDTEPLREWLKESGYDAIQFPRGLDGGDQVATVVLEPTQIKSATGNRGTYDPNDPDIRKARGGLAVKRKKK